MEGLLNVVVLERLNAARWVEGRQVSSETPGYCYADESHVDDAAYLGKRLVFSHDRREISMGSPEIES